MRPADRVRVASYPAQRGMNDDPSRHQRFELVRYSPEVARTRPVLGEGEALWIGGPGNVCDTRMKCLSAFRSLWGLHVTELSIFDLDALRRWTALRYLSIDGDERALDLTEFTELEWLVVADWWKALTLPLASTPIRRFAVWKLPGDDLSSIPAWRDLRELKLVQGRAISLEGVERFDHLEHVDIGYMRRLASVAALASCTNLCSAHFENCPRVEDWAALRRCGRLRELVLFKCGTIPSLRFLDDMPPMDSVRLIRTYVADGDMTPLIRMKQAVFDFRRGYSHHETEIQAMIHIRRGIESSSAAPDRLPDEQA